MTWQDESVASDASCAVKTKGRCSCSCSMSACPLLLQKRAASFCVHWTV